jgi:hypothetical protein
MRSLSWWAAERGKQFSTIAALGKELNGRIGSIPKD